MTSPACIVKNCTTPASEIFTIRAGGDGLPLQYAVCTFHGQALRADEPFSVGANEDGNTVHLALGSEMLPQVVNMNVRTDGLAPAIVTLMLGHDGMEEQRISFHMTREQAESLSKWA
jgi:hypothetical protein